MQVDKNNLYEALNSVIRENEEIAKIVVKDPETQRNITILESEIIYIQADNVYSTVVTANNSYIYLNSISELQKNLRGDYFYRTNRSYIVNFNYISSYSTKEITLVNGHKALISKLKLKEFKTSYLSFIRRKSMGEDA
ncbi:MAG: LytTR family transcriptional regulator DNA-binding domain-containing protein [Ruminococcus flavefaciens]|nr:LytTR family transcriptional regulator DNA-binding domain-containing protein [Ruminococcus flavefaciens]